MWKVSVFLRCRDDVIFSVSFIYALDIDLHVQTEHDKEYTSVFHFKTTTKKLFQNNIYKMLYRIIIIMLQRLTGIYRYLDISNIYDQV